MTILTDDPVFWEVLPKVSLNQQDRQKILDSGLSQIVRISAEDLEDWRAVMKPVWDEFSEEIGEEIMAATPAGGGS